MYNQLIGSALAIACITGASLLAAQGTRQGMHFSFPVEPLTRPAPMWPKALTHVSQFTPLPAGRSTVCPMPVVRGGAPHDSMPVARRDSAIAQPMPVAPGECRSASPSK